MIRNNFILFISLRTTSSVFRARRFDEIFDSARRGGRKTKQKLILSAWLTPCEAQLLL